MCTTAFKKLCRRFAIAKWPHRQLRGIDKKIAALRAALNYSTGDRHTCQRSILALEEEKARLTQAALGSPLSSGVSPRTNPPSAGKAVVPPLGAEGAARSPSIGAVNKKRKAEEGAGKKEADKKRRESKGAPSLAGGAEELILNLKDSLGDTPGPAPPRGLAAIEMLVSAATQGPAHGLGSLSGRPQGHGADSEASTPGRSLPVAGDRPGEGPGPLSGHCQWPGGPINPSRAASSVSAMSAMEVSRALSLGGLGARATGATPFNTPPLDPVSPLLPVPVPASAHVPPLYASTPTHARPLSEMLPLAQWSVMLPQPALHSALSLSPGSLLMGSLSLPQPSWGIAAPGRGAQLGRELS
eukprot:898876-Rhodomonas_salina.1